jgi:hypothetical protein
VREGLAVLGGAGPATGTLPVFVYTTTRCPLISAPFALKPVAANVMVSAPFASSYVVVTVPSKFTKP